MQGDFSRITFDAADGYRSVLLQQGRVLLDADLNEQAAITAHHDEVRLRDVTGRVGGPAGDGTTPGPFAVTDAAGTIPAGSKWADLRVTAGTYYVDGILCESDAARPLTDQPHLPDPGLAEPRAAAGDRYALYLDVWTRHVTADEDPALIDPALGGPDTTTRAQTVWQVGAVQLTGGELCQDLHAPDWLRRTPRRMAAELAPPAGDADPCRITGSGGYERLENQLYRVQVHETGANPSFVWSRDNGSVVAGLLTLTPGPAGSGTATLGLDRAGRDAELSILEKQLVEVTSRDRELRGLPGYLATTGAPDELDLPVTWLAGAPANRAELGRSPIVRRWDGGPLPVRATGNELEAGITVRFPAGGEPRTGDYWTIPARTVRLSYGLTQLSGTIEWTPPGPRPPAGIEHHLAPLALMRRTAGGWDLESDCRDLFPPLTGLAAIDLIGGDGQEAMPGDPLPEPVRVAVRKGSLPVAGARIGADAGTGHLSATAAPDEDSPRTLSIVTRADGSAGIRWLPDPDGPDTQTLTVTRLDEHDAPIGVAVVATARLGVARQVAWTPPCSGFAGTRTVQQALERLATTTDLRLLGGDGQQVAGDGDRLPQPVRVVVDSPCGPVTGVRVIAQGLGRLWNDLGKDPAADVLPLTTADDGTVQVWWEPRFGDERSATLDLSLDGADEPPVRVTAQLVPPVRTPGIHLTRLRFGGGKVFLNDSDIGAADLVNGIFAELDANVLMPSVNRKPVLRVELDLPWPLPGEDGRVWLAEAPIGYRTVILDAIVNSDNRVLTWSPAQRTREWLSGALWNALQRAQWSDPILGRFVVLGWAIVADDQRPDRHLNGYARAVLTGTRTDLLLPTTDEVPGGVFEQWFRLSQRVGDRPRLPGVERRTPVVARRMIEDLGLTVAAEVTEPDPVIRKGLVIRTDPAAGTELEPGAAVTLIVSEGRG